MDSKGVLDRLNEISSLKLIKQEEELKKIVKDSDIKITQLRNQLNDLKSLKLKEERKKESKRR